MELTDREIRIVRAVFNDLIMKFTDRELNTFIGSETIKGMKVLERKLFYSTYCKAHGIAYEDMTEDDFIQEYEERMCWQNEWWTF